MRLARGSHRGMMSVHGSGTGRLSSEILQTICGGGGGGGSEIRHASESELERARVRFHDGDGDDRASLS